MHRILALNNLFVQTTKHYKNYRSEDKGFRVKNNKYRREFFFKILN